MARLDESGPAYRHRILPMEQCAGAPPEQRLWVAVFERVLLDARGFVKATPNMRRAIKAEASAWLATADEDFAEVAEMAGLNPYGLRKHLPRLLELAEENAGARGAGQRRRWARVRASSISDAAAGQ